jgi:hypothetical protein
MTRAAFAALLLCSARAGAQTGSAGSSAPIPSASATTSPRRLVISVGGERLDFGTGITEADAGGANPVRVQSATALSSSVQFSTVLREVWLLDIGTSFSSGSRSNAAVGTAAATTSDLNGLGDVRVRVSRRIERLGLRITAAANLPTGVTSLDAAQTATLSVIGAPALAMAPPSVGFGPGGTLGVVKSVAAASRQWGVAMGASVEWRGSYEPFAALAAGVPLASYDPGEVVRLSAGGTRLFGQSKGVVTASLDLFGTDQVTAKGAGTPIGVKIGPTFAVDAQWLPATTRLSNAGVFAGVRVRSPLQRDGQTVEGSGNVLFEAGGRGAKALSSTVDAVFEVTGRVHTAVQIDNRLATAAGTSVAPALGLAFSGATWTVQPMVTVRLGTVDTGVQSGSFKTVGARLVFDRRF